MFLSKSSTRATSNFLRSKAYGLLLGVMGFSAISCGKDQFTTVGTRDAVGAGGISSTDPDTPCCGGSAGALPLVSGGSAGVDMTFRGACELSLSYCAVDWAGKGAEPGFAEGAGSEARFSQLSGVTSVGRMLYVTHGHAVSMVNSETRAVTLLAGSQDSGDTLGVGEEARFESPTGIAHHEGFLYVSDTGNRKVKRIDLESGNVSTYLTHLISGPSALEVLPADDGMPGFLFIADEVLHIIVRVEIAAVAPTPGVISGTLNMSGNNSVLLNRPYGLARIGKDLFVTERGNHWVRKIDLSRPPPISLEEVWGSGVLGFAEGVGRNALLTDPTGIAADGGVLYVMDAGNAVMRRGTPDGSLDVVVGAVGDSSHVEGLGEDARFLDPRLMHLDEEGNLYLSEGSTLRRIAL